MGLATLYFKKLYPNARIIAFEPSDKAFKFLKRNTKNLSDITLVHAALSDNPGTLDYFSFKHRPSDVGGTTVTKTADAKQKDFNQKTEVQKVKTIRLSDFIEGEVDFLKMDIEGSEILVLRNLRDAKKLKNVSEIVMEYHHDYFDGPHLQEILQILKDFKVVVWQDAPSKNIRKTFERKKTHFNMISAWV
ncbi:MAG: FkbM family methyltransferase [Patescibacteria group bacterium]|nr:FkbM family methyltransferase [Patescibacteria group bacterium]